MTNRRPRVTLVIVLATLAATTGAVSPSASGESTQAEKMIRILEPKDGDKIFLEANESMPAQRPVRGDVVGFTREEIENFKLTVHVTIKTDKVYPQGIARVGSDGTWKIRSAHFGGAVHTLRAVLKDKNDSEIASDVAEVTIVQ
jgi:ABC-type protease/lipase transport system fused ATPase/permease subunit